MHLSRLHQLQPLLLELFWQQPGLIPTIPLERQRSKPSPRGQVRPFGGDLPPPYPLCPSGLSAGRTTACISQRLGFAGPLAMVTFSCQVSQEPFTLSLLVRIV